MLVRRPEWTGGCVSRRTASAAFLKRLQEAFNRSSPTPISTVQTVSIGSLDKVSKMGLGALSIILFEMYVTFLRTHSAAIPGEIYAPHTPTSTESTAS